MTQDIENTKTQLPTKTMSKTMTNFPYQMTAQAMTSISKRLCGADHPAADLATMNDKILTMLEEEGDQTCMLRRQAQLLDAVFHAQINTAFQEDETYPFYEPTSSDTTALHLALRAQKLCLDTVNELKKLEYNESKKAYMSALSHALNAPKILNEQTEGGD